MADSFWVQSDNCSLPGARRIPRSKCSFNLISLRCCTPNRGHYDISERRAVSLGRLADSLFWWCAGGRKPFADEDNGDSAEQNISNYSSRSIKMNASLPPPPPPPRPYPAQQISRTFTKKVFKRKCRPPLRFIGHDFGECEHFLKAVSSYIALIEWDVLLQTYLENGWKKNAVSIFWGPINIWKY